MAVPDIFETLRDRGFNALEQLVDEEFQESVTLEFKTKKDHSRGSFDREDKRNLGTTLSAFSNSMGGVLIWGIDCRKNEDGIDCAQKLTPINGIEKFHSESNNLVGEYLKPRNEDVQVFLIEDATVSGAGYLVIGVGKSGRRPCRSEAPGDGKYYKRVGASSFPMEHYDIEDAFRSRDAADLHLEVELSAGGPGRSGGVDYLNLTTTIEITNQSPVTATYPYVKVSGLQGGSISRYGVDGNGNAPLPQLVDTRWSAWGGGSDSFLHPEQSIQIAKIITPITNNAITDEFRNRSSLLSNSVLYQDFHLVFDYEVTCRDAPLKKGRIEKDFSDILDSLPVSFTRR